jgi:hypothetical protein
MPLGYAGESPWTEARAPVPGIQTFASQRGRVARIPAQDRSGGQSPGQPAGPAARGGGPINEVVSRAEPRITYGLSPAVT